MNREMLERLAANPHYIMTKQQLDALAAYRRQDVIHDTSVPKHSTTFDKHPTGLRKEGDESDRRPMSPKA